VLEQVFDRTALAVARHHEELHEAKERAEHAANYDALTGLANRAFLLRRVGMEMAAYPDAEWALLFLDLDGFKQVNDCHGHFIGDGLLAAVADRLLRNARSMDTVARVGGDEFIFILNEIGTADNAAYVARKIIASLAQTFLIQDRTCQIGGSIGIAVFPEDGDNMEDIIKLADDAMYLAKKNGKGKYVFINQSPLAQGVLKLDEP
jgi:diguanylate cyclase (GGDEF)-like protein